ncbi:unnamed protein product [Prunus armeniaca]|uniref:Uncharacterized protein n=1 Tax=Prunus armeniaca TaxID=36596 RepID=A0A6J5V8X3_PRUAR|nr:unnamed protein product [Prunus armeniaca]
MALNLGFVVGILGVVILSHAAYSTVQYRGLLKIMEEEFSGPPLNVVIELLLGLVLCMWAALTVPGTFLSIHPHSEENRTETCYEYSNGGYLQRDIIKLLRELSRSKRNGIKGGKLDHFSTSQPRLYDLQPSCQSVSRGDGFEVETLRSFQSSEVGVFKQGIEFSFFSGL